MLTVLTVVAVIALMISVNGLYVAAEFATVASRRTRVHRLAAEGNPLAKGLLAIMEDGKQLDDYVAACQLGITISSLVLGAYGQNQVSNDLLGPLTRFLEWSGLNVDAAATAETLAFLIVIVSLTTLQVLLGELFPKSISIQYPETVAMAVVYPMRISMFVLRPLIWLFNGSGRIILRLLGQSAHKDTHAHIHSPEEIEILVAESAQGGLLDSEERQMLRNAFRLRDLVAREVMVHRTRLAAASIESRPIDLIELALEEGFSRMPLYQGNIDNVKGFVHIKDVFRLYVEEKENLAEIMREVVHVPETLPAADVWETLRNKRQYVAIVFDEYGGTAGMITLEDLIEEIFGELQDEFDDETAIMSLGKDGRVYLRGDLLISDVNEYLGLQLPDDEADTLSGLLFSALGRTPRVGDEANIGETVIRVEVMADFGVEELSLQTPGTGVLPRIEEWGLKNVIKWLGFMTIVGVTLAAAPEFPSFSAFLLPGIIILVLVLINGFFVGAEFAIIGVRPSKVEQMADEGNSRAQGVQKILADPKLQDRYIATAQLGITIASLGLGYYGEPAVAHLVEPFLAVLLNVEPDAAIVHTVSYILILSLLTYLHVVVGEMVPKSLALAAADRVVLTIYPAMMFAETILKLPVRVLNGIGAGLLKLLRVPPAEGHARLYLPEEIEQIVNESTESGLLNEGEQEIINNIFDFSERLVSQVMTPRPKVQAIPYNIERRALLQMVTQATHTRFPVYENDLDHIIGILHMKDLVRQEVKMKGTMDIRLILRPAPAVPQDMHVEKLLARFKKQRLHMAVVLDEFGGMAGVVTLEDLVEEIVGEVRDEFDEEKEPVVELEPGLLEVAGSFLVEDLQEYIFLGEEAELPDVDTVGGLIVTWLGRPPQIGDTVKHQDVIKFTVLDISGLAVARAKIEFPTPEQNTPTQE